MPNSDYVYYEVPGGHPIKAWVSKVDIEEKALEQLKNTARMPFIYHHLAVMPDVHWGMGSTVGSVVATRGAIIPAAVGVDIGCGMMAYETQFGISDLPDNLGPLRAEIERLVPVGRTDNGGANDRGAWSDIPRVNEEAWGQMVNGYCEIALKYPQALPRNANTGRRQWGTLGTGNHFIEICYDERGVVWIMLHSGSRGIGNRIGSYFIEQAKRLAADGMYAGWLPDRDLAYLPESSPLFQDYVSAVDWAQEYARINRELIMAQVVRAFNKVLGGVVIFVNKINCHHNYIARENHFGSNVIVTRKGAVRARVGDYGIIPGSMGAKSFIVTGRGCSDSFNSCSHGAGRKMSRGAAERTFSVADLELQTSGVNCRKDAGVLDEIPGAYKDIDDVMDSQQDLVDIVHTLKQVCCIKG